MEYDSTSDSQQNVKKIKPNQIVSTDNHNNNISNNNNNNNNSNNSSSGVQSSPKSTPSSTSKPKKSQAILTSKIIVPRFRCPYPGCSKQIMIFCFIQKCSQFS